VSFSGRGMCILRPPHLADPSVWCFPPRGKSPSLSLGFSPLFGGDAVPPFSLVPLVFSFLEDYNTFLTAFFLVTTRSIVADPHAAGRGPILREGDPLLS